MFKWLCLGLAVGFLTLATWMLNDIRLEVRKSAEPVQKTAATLNENLPPIVERTRKTAEVVDKNLPEVVEKVRAGTETISANLPEMVKNIHKTTETLAELSEDIRQLKELLGATNANARDKTIVAYANSLLSAIEKSEGEIGNKKAVGTGLKNKISAAEWCVAARREATVLTIIVKSRKEMLERLGKTKFGFHWYIDIPGKGTQTLIDWAKANHAESKNLDG